MLVVLFIPPGIIVKPPNRLEAVLETPMARKVTLGSDLRLKGSILSMAWIVASDSVPSIRTSVIMVITSGQYKSGLEKASAKLGNTMPCSKISLGHLMRYFSSPPRSHAVKPASTITTRGTGTNFAHPALIRESIPVITKRRINVAAPMAQISGFNTIICSGTDAMALGMDLMGGMMTQRKDWTRLIMISMPMAINMPSTTEMGKYSANLPALKTLKITWTTPTRAMATSTSG